MIRYIPGKVALVSGSLSDSLTWLRGDYSAKQITVIEDAILSFGDDKVFFSKGMEFSIKRITAGCPQFVSEYELTLDLPSEDYELLYDGKVGARKVTSLKEVIVYRSPSDWLDRLFISIELHNNLSNNVTLLDKNLKPYQAGKADGYKTHITDDHVALALLAA